MSEADMRQKLVAALKSYHGVSVENYVGPGTPDINFVEGWIECKWLCNWPKRESTVVKLTHDLTEQQIAWCTRRYNAGGNIWVAFQCGKTWLFYRPKVAAKFFNKSTKNELIQNANISMLSGLDEARLVGEIVKAWLV